MAIGTDRVQVAKFETVSGGGDGDDESLLGTPDPIEPQEDVIESAGGYVQDATARDETVGWYRSNGILYQFDSDHPYPGIAIGSGGFNVDTILVNEDGDVLTNEDGNVLVSG
jgi:hypothetical protein